MVFSLKIYIFAMVYYYFHNMWIYFLIYCENSFSQYVKNDSH